MNLISDNVLEDITKHRTITLSSYRNGPLCAVRLERLTPKQEAKLGDGDGGGEGGERRVVHRGEDGVFKGVVVLKEEKKPHSRVCKPHVMTSFNAYVIDTSQEGGFLERPRKKEKRTLRFWLYRSSDDNNDDGGGHDDDDGAKIAVCSNFIRLLIEPETFPVDGVSFLKKTLLLMRHHARLKRIELEFQMEPDEEPEEPIEIPLIENFITVLTPAAYDYQYLPEVPVSRKSAICFRLRASADGHVALSYVYGDTDRRTYEIVLGGMGNKKSVIRYGGRGETMIERHTPGILDSSELRPFWISWNVSSVRVGRGLEANKNLIMEWANIPPHQHHLINLVSVSTGPGSEGKWEFVEYIVPYEMTKESKGSRRLKVLKSLVWYSKKMKIMERLEDAYPCSLTTPQLLRLSTVKLSNMLEAVMFLKKTQKDGQVIEISKGVWLRSHCHPSDIRHELKIVPHLPHIYQSNAPTVAIVTMSYVEKMAVDAMFDEKMSFIVKGDGGDNSLFTMGRMGSKMVVATKLGNFSPEVGCTDKHGEMVSKIIKQIPSIRYLYLVSVGGAVPHYTNYDLHCRRGDVVLSGPRTTDGAFYLVCPEVDDVEPEVDPTGRSAFFPTSCWNGSGDGLDSLQRRAAMLVEGVGGIYRKYEKWKKWDSFVEQAQLILVKTDERFHRPSQKTDKLQAQLDRRQPVITVSHPPCPANHARRENQPSLRIGAIASGEKVSRDHLYRRIFAQQNRIAAYDCGLGGVVQAVMDSRLGSNNVEIVLGMCDYSDGQVGKSWQPYAALVAAAACKVMVVEV